MPLIGIPSFIKSAGPGAPACTHYFVSVRPTVAGVPGELPEAAEDAESKPEAGAATGIVKMPTITTITKTTALVRTLLCLCVFIFACFYPSILSSILSSIHHPSIHPFIHSFTCLFDDLFIKDRQSLRVRYIQSWLAPSDEVSMIHCWSTQGKQRACVTDWHMVLLGKSTQAQTACCLLHAEDGC